MLHQSSRAIFIGVLVAMNSITASSTEKNIAHPDFLTFTNCQLISCSLLGATLFRYTSREPDTLQTRYSFERLKQSLSGSLTPEQQQFTCIIIGFDSAKKLKKSIDTLSIGLYDTHKKQIVGVTKAQINAPASDKKALLKKLGSLQVSTQPNNIIMVPGAEPDYWVTPSCYCTINVFALRSTVKRFGITSSEQKKFLAYELVSPKFIDLADATSFDELTTIQALSNLYDSQQAYTKNILHELTLLVDDGLIGHSFKSGSPRVNPENHKLEAGETCLPKGLYGNIQANWKALAATAGSVTALWNLKNKDDKDNAKAKALINYIQAVWSKFIV